MIQPTQFSLTYPDRAGSKERGSTSQDAADAIEASGKAEILRTKVLAHFRAGHRATPAEVAEAERALGVAR